MTINRLIKLTLVFTLAVILMGAYTRLSDAGLGCPDWPGCYGQLTVPTEVNDITKAQQQFPERQLEQDKAWLEMIHRYIAATLGVMVLAILIMSLRQPQAPKKLPIFISLLIIFQAALGMWTVTMKLMPIIVMLHLLGGFSLFSLLLLLYLRNKPLRIPGGDSYARQLAPLAAISLVVLIIQIILGGWTSSNYAALACTSLPICEGNWVDNLQWAKAFSPFQGDHPSYEFGVLDYAARMTIHVSHRLWAIVTAVVLLLLAFKLILSQSTTMRKSGYLLTLLVIVQVALGISNVVMHLPLGIAVSHNGGAALLLLTVVFINYAIVRKA
ncbi:heme A synthase [Shewanella intestini]|uniref:Heme A synthase n=1 Tax=Shewanella intestini TaxID=2017544 RepID=A0ABS5I444_9GAMM|nr:MULTISPECIES: COX15/CtaA family protein [Shewanella]MBR9728075.1 heme A synthase [Shewanella intestini]MRG36547.1 heme A synthase [Shewanella sp. XMDDZSB0408]